MKVRKGNTEKKGTREGEGKEIKKGIGKEYGIVKFTIRKFTITEN